MTDTPPTPNSATGGYLQPADAGPSDDDALDDTLGDMIAGITGLDRDQYVRPSFQDEPPDLPDFGVDWCGFYVTKDEGETYAHVRHDGSANGGDGADIVITNETFTLTATFYGPNSDRSASLLREGLKIDQNREALRTAGIAVLYVSDFTAAPTLIKQRYLSRTDLTVTLRRQIQRVYNVLNLLSAPFAVEQG